MLLPISFSIDRSFFLLRAGMFLIKSATRILPLCVAGKTCGANLRDGMTHAIKIDKIPLYNIVKPSEVDFVFLAARLFLRPLLNYCLVQVCFGI